MRTVSERELCHERLGRQFDQALSAYDTRRRVEVLTPVFDPAARQRLDAILTAELATPYAWLLRADGGYDPPENEKAANIAAFSRT